jgi:hypothetical protein
MFKEKYIYSVLYPAGEGGTHWGTFSSRKRAIRALKLRGIKKKLARIDAIIVDYRLTSRSVEGDYKYELSN